MAKVQVPQGSELLDVHLDGRAPVDTPTLLVPVLCHREISAEMDREPQQLQNYWSEVRYMVRCIYRQAGTPLADDQDQSLVPDKEGVKELVDRYKLPLIVMSLCKFLPSPASCGASGPG